jgi:hypothetical protein
VRTLPLALGGAAVIAGVALALTLGSLLGYLLIIGGVTAVGWTMVPAIVAFFVRWLSVGR